MTPLQAQSDLAVVILSYNEEANIRRAIDSVKDWVREIHVLDSYSSDRTVEIAESCPGVRVARRAFRDYGDQWNWAIRNLPIRASWILKLDADEQVTPPLRKEIATVLAEPDRPYVGYYLRRYLYFMNRRLRFGGFSSCWHLRLWRRGKGRFEQRSVNEQVVLDGPTGRLRSYLSHDDRKGLSAWIWRHNRYSTMEAEEACFAAQNGSDLSGAAARRRRLKQRIWPLVPFKPIAYFLYVYIIRLGFLDGAAGYHMCRLRSVYHYFIELKKKEARLLGFVSSQETMTPMPRTGPDTQACPPGACTAGGTADGRPLRQTTRRRDR